MTLEEINRNYSKYLGRYLDLSKEEGDENQIVEVLVIDSNGGILNNGRHVSYIELDTDFDKIHNIYDAPEVKNELKQHSNLIQKSNSVSSITEGLSIEEIEKNELEKIMTISSENDIEKNEKTIIKEQLTDLQKFIKIAVERSKDKKEQYSIPLNIDLTFDFNLMKVLLMCIEVFDNEEEIVKEVFKYSNLNTERINEIIMKAILSPSENDSKPELNEQFDTVLKAEIKEE